jgi:thiamine-monophosphate kinase
MSRASGRPPLQHALTDGEDFELLITTESREASRLLSDQPLQVPLTRIGTVVAQTGQWQIDDHGNQSPLPAQGYLH